MTKTTTTLVEKPLTARAVNESLAFLTASAQTDEQKRAVTRLIADRKAGRKVKTRKHSLPDPAADAEQMELPEAYQPLLNLKCRYKVYHGGRGSAKSMSYAIALLILASMKKVNILCCREIQNSIADSVHRLLSSLIEKYNLSDTFEIQRNIIRCMTTGSEFHFEGLFRNTDKIKSYYDVDIAWLCEAQPVSEDSLQILFPTIRNPESEIWIEFNDKYFDDPVYRRFVTDPPSNAFVKKVSYLDNPWFPPELQMEMENDFKYRPKAANNIWLGDLKGAGGLVWDFDPKVHIKEFSKEDLKTANVFMAIDPHQVHFSAAVWIALIPSPDKSRLYKWIFAEWPKISTLNGSFADVRTSVNYGGTYSDMAREFYATESESIFCDPGKSLKIYGRFIDSRFAAGTGAANWSSKTEGIVAEFAKPANGGLDFISPPCTIIDSRRDVIKKDMEFNTKTSLSSINQPCLYVSESCQNVIQSFTSHRYEEDSEKESERFKDFSDAIRICYSGFADHKYKDPTKKILNDYYDFGTSGRDWMAL